MKSEYSGWSGVRKLAKKLGYSWFDVCDILWKTKHHKQPEFKEILLFSVIRKNLIRIKSGKHLRDVHGNLLRRNEGEHDTHYRKDYSRLVYWCNPFEPINRGKLGTTQGWRKEKKFPVYY
jgi:capsid portal protein